MAAPTGTGILEQSPVEDGNVLLTKAADFLEVGCNQWPKHLNALIVALGGKFSVGESCALRKAATQALAWASYTPKHLFLSPISQAYECTLCY
jgi:hypothetical protein